MSAFFQKLLTRLAIPFLEWVAVKVYNFVSEWNRKRAEKKKIKAKNKAVTEKTLKAQTKEERDSAAENTINSF